MSRPVPNLARRRAAALARRLLRSEDAVASRRLGWRSATRLLERVDEHQDSVPQVRWSAALERVADRVRTHLTSPEQIDLIIGEFHVSVSSPPPPIPLARRTPAERLETNVRAPHLVLVPEPEPDFAEHPISGVFQVGEVQHGQRTYTPLPPPPLSPGIWKKVAKG